MFAIWAAECVFVPINYKLHPREMVQILDDAGATPGVRVAEDRGRARLDVTDVPVEAVDSAEYQSRFTATPSAPPRDTDPAALAWLFYTSGTTGRSKGAMLSHRNLMAMTVAHLADFDSPDEDCSLVHGAPMSHGSGLYVAPYVLRGARQVIPESARVRTRRVPRSVRAPPGLQRLPGPDDGAATGRDRPGPRRATFAPSSTAAARCTSTA